MRPRQPKQSAWKSPSLIENGSLFAYRPESIDRKLFFDELHMSLNKAFLKYDYISVIGD